MSVGVDAINHIFNIRYEIYKEQEKKQTREKMNNNSEMPLYKIASLQELVAV